MSWTQTAAERTGADGLIAVEHQGLSLWYGGTDTPAPRGEQPRQGAAVVVGVAPANPCNAVSIRYRVDGGVIRTLPAGELLRERRPDGQRFRAIFPTLPAGSTVEYQAVLTSAGRQLPPPGQVGPLPASFRVAGDTLPAAPAAPAPANETYEPAPIRTEYLGTCTVDLVGPELIGKTPDGLKVNWWVKAGTIRGPRLNGIVRPEGADWMTVRPDGIGNVDVRATFEMDDGALISAHYGGVFELGEDGYANFLVGKFLPLPRMWGSPKYLTSDPRYLWLNRLQCVVQGQVQMDRHRVVYDIHALR